jgi:hypothetical protein
MKSNIIKYLTSAAFALAVTASVQATQISGTIRQSGDVTLDTQDLATANGATAFANVNVAGTPTGDFSTTGGSLVVWKPFTWVPSSAPVVSLWSFASGGKNYSFDLASITGVTRTDSTELLITGLGTVNISTFDPTPANWSFTITDTSGGVSGSFVFGFADSNTATLPDGGMTVMLLGAALSGLALIRRKLA